MKSLDPIDVEIARERKLLKMKGLQGVIARTREHIINIDTPNHSEAFSWKLKALSSLIVIEETLKALEKENEALKRRNK